MRIEQVRAMAVEAGFSLGRGAIVQMTDIFAMTGKAALRRGLGNEIRFHCPMTDEAFHHGLAVLAGLPFRGLLAVTVGTLLGCGHLRMSRSSAPLPAPLLGRGRLDGHEQEKKDDEPGGMKDSSHRTSLQETPGQYK